MTVQVEDLDMLAPIGLADLVKVADLQTRQDRKYLVPLCDVLAVIGRHTTALRVLDIGDRRSFQYESTYFDTPDLASYLGAARHRPRRFKVRTRSYLESQLCVLELKLRDSRGRTVKHRFPHHLDRRDELDHLARDFLTTFTSTAAHVDELAPLLTTRYHRSTLLMSDSAARVTIDTDLEWNSRHGQRIELLGSVLVETKTSGRPCDIDRALWRQGHRPVIISKYCTGLAALQRHLPSNKWARVIARHLPDGGCEGPSQ